MSNSVERFVAQCRGHDVIGFEAHIMHVRMKQIESLDEQMRSLNTSVIQTKAPTVEEYCEAEEVACVNEWLADWHEWRRFSFSWTEFYLSWRRWVEDHFSLMSRMSSEAVQEYENFSASYNEWLKRFKRQFPKETTEAKKHAPGTAKELDLGIGTPITAVAIAVAVVGAFLILRETK